MFGRVSNKISMTARSAGLAMLAATIATVGVEFAAPADAVGATLTVTTLDRLGHSVRTQYIVVSARDGARRNFWTGHAHQLSPGTYDVFAAIASDGSGDTVGVKRVRVSGART